MRLTVKLKPEPLLNLKLSINRPEYGMLQSEFTDPERMTQASVLKGIVHFLTLMSFPNLHDLT